MALLDHVSASKKSFHFQAPLDKQKLQDFLNDQALNTPDIPDHVPFVPGTIRGKKWVPPPKPKDNSGNTSCKRTYIRSLYHLTNNSFLFQYS